MAGRHGRFPPRAPSQAEWDAMSPAERDRAVAALPSAMTEEETAPPEGDPHFNAKASAKEVLQAFFRRLGRHVYVACDLTVYYPDEPRFAPDLLAVRDVDPRERMKWVVSAEGKGLDLVMEVHVAGDRRKDLETNVRRYAGLGIPEYVIYDRGQLRLHGYHLVDPATRLYSPITPVAGRLASDVLGLELVVEDGRLRFYQGTAQLLEAAELAERMGRLVGDLEASADARARSAKEQGELDGRRAACLALVEARLGHVASHVSMALAALTDPAAIESIVREVARAADVEAVRSALARLT